MSVKGVLSKGLGSGKKFRYYWNELIEIFVKKLIFYINLIDLLIIVFLIGHPLFINNY